MTYKQKGFTPFTQSHCSPGSNCKPGGRRTNKFRQTWNKLKANVSEKLTKRKIAPNAHDEGWEGFDPNKGQEYKVVRGDTIWKEPDMLVSPGPNKKSK